jgi:hypothetical protein
METSKKIDLSISMDKANGSSPAIVLPIAALQVVLNLE